MKIPWSTVATRLPGLGLVACVGYWLLRPEASQTQNVVIINQDLGLVGRVTGYNKARGNKIFLNSSAVPYNFDQFENLALAQHNGLGYYLVQGDSVYKLPNARVLRIVRQGQQSIWHLVSPVMPAP
jgi:hypothetical protein